MFYYVISLREGIMDAWGGIIGAMKSSGKSMLSDSELPTCRARHSADRFSTAQILQQYVPAIFQLLNLIATDANRSESLMRAAMGVIG
jgi:importin subunit beta-1